MATCYAMSSNKITWLVDSGCTNHMTYNASLFKGLDRSYTFKVNIGNEEHMDVKGKNMVELNTYSGTKFISDFFCLKQKKTF